MLYRKQKIGEKIFKLFKDVSATSGERITDMSKKTVTLLDQEDLPSLLHCATQFPDVLVAKARIMSTD